MQGLTCELLAASSDGWLQHTKSTLYNRPQWRLHSTASQTCVVTWTYCTFSDRAFAAAGPGAWNSLPSHMKVADLSFNEF